MLKDVTQGSLSYQECEQLYATAYSLYERGDYHSAAQLFTQLILCDPFLEKGWRGLAATRQMAQEYEAALHAWCLVALLKEEDPLPHFHAAECYLSLNEKEDALKALNTAHTRCNDPHLRSKIELLKTLHLTSL